MTTAITLGIPTPTFSSALAFFDGYRSDWLPANLLQVSSLEVFGGTDQTVATYHIYICHMRRESAMQQSILRERKERERD